MSSSSGKVIALRRLLGERFPSAPVRPRRRVSTGVPRIDALLQGGLMTGALTEFVSLAPSGGNQATLGSLLLGARADRQRVALIDGAGSFSLEGLDDDAVAHVVWVRCRDLDACWRTLDVVVRDPNYQLVALDVRGYPARELLRARDAIWVRVQRAAEESDIAVAVQTDTVAVPNAVARIVFDQALAPECLVQPRAALTAGLAPALQRLRSGRERAG